MLNELKYLECCIDETLRKYPVIPVIVRIATKDYKIEDSHLVIPQGTSVLIPALGFHRDPEIYDNPLEFRPERFLNSSNGNGKTKGSFHLSFGDGPRNCNAAKLGKVIIKICLMQIFSKFKLEFSNPSIADKELKLHPNQVFMTPIETFDIRLTVR